MWLACRLLVAVVASLLALCVDKRRKSVLDSKFHHSSTYSSIDLFVSIQLCVFSISVYNCLFRFYFSISKLVEFQSVLGFGFAVVGTARTWNGSAFDCIRLINVTPEHYLVSLQCDIQEDSDSNSQEEYTAYNI